MPPLGEDLLYPNAHPLPPPGEHRRAAAIAKPPAKRNTGRSLNPLANILALQEWHDKNIVRAMNLRPNFLPSLDWCFKDIERALNPRPDFLKSLDGYLNDMQRSLSPLTEFNDYVRATNRYGSGIF